MKKLNTFGEEIKGSFRERNRATGIVINDKKEIILMNLTNMYFHMLPGGGVDLYGRGFISRIKGRDRCKC